MSTAPILALIEIRKRRVAIECAFDDLAGFGEFIEDALVHRKFEHYTAAKLSGLFYPEKVSEDNIERFQVERSQLQSEFPQALRIALLGLTLSTFETQVVAVANWAAERRLLSKRFEKFWPAKSFVDSELGNRVDKELWESIQAYRDVRNTCLHNDCRVDVPLASSADPLAAAKQIVADVVDSRITLSRACVAAFPTLCRRVCLRLVPAA